MAVNLIDKIVTDAQTTGATYVIIVVSEDGIAYTSDGGTRRSTRRYRISNKEILECEKILKTFDDRNLLFAKTIMKYSFQLRDGRTSEFYIDKTDEASLTIKGKKFIESKEKEYKWVRYFSDGAGVAFFQKELKTDIQVIFPREGKIFDGLMEKEAEQDIYFCASGCDSQIGQALLYALKEVVYKREFRNVSFGVLPSTMDDDNPFNVQLLEEVKDFCRKYPLYRNTAGTFANKDNTAIGTKEVTDLFPQELASRVCVNVKKWMREINPESREEYFLMADIGIVKYDRERFLGEIFQDGNLDDLSMLLAEQNDRWLRKFYIFCALPIAEERIKRMVISGLKNTESLRDNKGRMCYPNKISLASDEDVTLKTSTIVKRSLIRPGGHSDEFSELLETFFTKELEVAEYSLVPDMEQLAMELATKKQPIDGRYCEKLIRLIRFWEGHPDEINLSTYALFPIETTKGLKRVEASKIVIGKPYLKEGALISKAVDKPVLWKGFKKLLTEDELNLLILFAEQMGAIGTPRIIMQPAEHHSEYEKTLFIEGKRYARDTDYDFTIPGLDDLLKKRSLQINKMIWEYINGLSKEEAEGCLYAEFSRNNRETVNRCESSLITILRQRSWIPDKNNKMKSPEDIMISDISDEFRYNRRNPIWKQLRFGQHIKEEAESLKQLEKLANKYGKIVISKQEYEEFLGWKREHDN